MKKIYSLLIALMVLSVYTTHAQTSTRRAPVRGSLTSGSIDSQFFYLNGISRNQDDFKLVRRTNLDLIRKNVLDSIQQLRRQLNDASSINENHKQSASIVQDTIQNLKQELKMATEERDNFSFFGIAMSKGAYSTVVWSIIGILLAILIFYIYRFNQSHSVTKETKSTFEELQEDYDQFRKKALEKEQKLKRQLQDEINRRTS